MKESYELILEKLKRDRLNFDKDIKDIIDEVDSSDTKMKLYHRILGRKQYCEELILFFEELLYNLK